MQTAEQTVSALFKKSDLEGIPVPAEDMRRVDIPRADTHRRADIHQRADTRRREGNRRLDRYQQAEGIARPGMCRLEVESVQADSRREPDSHQQGSDQRVHRDDHHDLHDLPEKELI